MNELDIFSYEGQQVRTVIIDGEPWFVARDVASILGYADPVNAVKQHCRGVAVHHPIVDVLGRSQSARVLSESDMLRLIVNSKLPAAVRFERWVFEDVLPTIRRTGQFGSQVPSSFAEALELAAVKVRELEAAEAKIALDAPKVAAYDSLMDADGYFTMEAAAKAGGIGRTTLFRRLREAGVIQHGSRLPYQRYMHWFKITVSTWIDGEGVSHPTQTARVRPEALPKVLAKAGVAFEAEVA